MSLNSRIKALEKLVAERGKCPSCNGDGHIAFRDIDGPPPTGCPECGRICVLIYFQRAIDPDGKLRHPHAVEANSEFTEWTITHGRDVGSKIPITDEDRRVFGYEPRGKGGA